MTRSRPVLLFDGDCGFCTWAIDQVRHWVRPSAEIADWQRSDLSALGISVDECTEAIQWVEVDGSHVTGGRAVAAMFAAAPQPWPVLARLMRLPVLAPGTDALYRIVAANRYRLPGSTPACQVPRKQAA